MCVCVLQLGVSGSSPARRSTLTSAGKPSVCRQTALGLTEIEYACEHVCAHAQSTRVRAVWMF